MKSDIRCQVIDKSEIKRQEQMNLYKIYNQETGEVYIQSRCEVVAMGCYRRKKEKHGDIVKIEITR